MYVLSTASMSVTSPCSWSGVRRRLMVSDVAMSSHSVAEDLLALGDELPEVLLPIAEPLVLDELDGEALGAARRQRAGVGDRDRARASLPPALATLAAGLVFAHEAGTLELAQVVARGAARLAEAFREAARGERAVRRELVVDPHPQGVREALQALAREHVVDAGVPRAARLGFEVVRVRASSMLQRYRCKEMFASVSLQARGRRLAQRSSSGSSR